MSSLVAELVHDALDSFAARDAELAVRVTVRDKNVDDFYNSIFRTLVTFMMENPKHITESAHLLFVAKNLERMGDHATNIAEMVYYVVTGERMRSEEHTSELQSLMRSSYAVFCLKKKKKHKKKIEIHT